MFARRFCVLFQFEMIRECAVGFHAVVSDSGDGERCAFRVFIYCHGERICIRRADQFIRFRAALGFVEVVYARVVGVFPPESERINPLFGNPSIFLGFAT